MRTRILLPALAAALATALPAWGQYKVVTPDGRVTYTDRPPADASVKVTELGKRSFIAPPVSGAGLPADLQQLATRFPVTLFTAANCTPCDSGRQLLRQRGVPYTEREVVGNEDVAALERTVGGRTVPALTIGGQALRGFSPGDWTAYLDAAGYPRESRLPPSWTPPAPTPLVPRPSTPVNPQAALAPPEPALEPVPVQPEEGTEGPTGIRF